MGDLQTASKAFGDFCLAQIQELAPPESAPPVLYHYTTSAGMLAIAQSGVLWAHNIERQNDYVEVRYAGSVLRGHLDRAYALEKHPEVIQLFGAMRLYMGKITMDSVFLLSFTGVGDEPGMWGLYADRGRGFSFALDRGPVLAWNCAFLRCQYNPDVLDDYCRRTLANVRAVFLNNGGLNSLVSLNDYVAMFFSHIVWFAPMFKPRVWQDEQEWRLIFVRQPEDRKVREDGRTHIVVPPAGQTPLNIRAICAGYDCDYENSILPVLDALRMRGILDVSMYLSNYHQTPAGRAVPEIDLSGDQPPKVLRRLVYPPKQRPC